MVMADFSGDEAEELRRALSFHRSQERMEKVSVKLRAAMARNNVAPEVIEKDYCNRSRRLRFMDFPNRTRSALRFWLMAARI